MTIVEVDFLNLKDVDARLPYICNKESVIYSCDGNEGSICFDGHYYVEDHAPPYPEDELLAVWDRPSRRSEWLPQKLRLLVKYRDNEPYKKEVDPVCGRIKLYYHYYQEKFYVIEIYKRDLHESTDRYSQIEDGDDMIEVCFFPTNKQTLYFRIIEEVL